MPEFDANPLALLAAVVASQVLGFLWYGPVFGRLWMQAMGKTADEMSGEWGAFVVGIGSSIVQALSLSLLLSLPSSVGVGTGGLYGLIAGIGFAATTVFTGAAFQETPRTVAVLFAGYQIVSMVTMGAILGAWR